MPGKTFRNKALSDLALTLTVRQGEEPEVDLTPIYFVLPFGAEQLCTYGSDRNPYLDGIALEGVGDKGFVFSQDFTITRGSAIDNDLNTNSYVTIAQSGSTFLLSFSNN